jgi:predicted nucleic acid-binding protein
MASKVFIDANILLDLTLKRKGYDQAADIIRHAILGKFNLFTSPTVLHILAYYTRKAYGESTSKILLLTLLTDIHIIDCNHETALLALNSSIADAEDALNYYTALKAGINYYISSDKELKKVAIPQLPVYSAKEFLE